MYSKQHSEFRDIQIDKQIPGLAGSILNMYYTLHVICIVGYRAGGLKISTFGSRVLGLVGSKLGLYCSVCCKQHSKLCDIQIEKWICGLVGSTLHFYWSVSSKQHSEFRDKQIDKQTPRLAGSRLNMYYTLHVICNTYYM
jgi:hypothetical protein